VDASPAATVVVAALAGSYPDWTDENGTNVEQLARIAVDALIAAGMLDARADSPRVHSHEG
jgi:hypothetical protein